MTALNFTMGRDFAVISQDRAGFLREGPLAMMVGADRIRYQKLYFDPIRRIVSGVRGNIGFALVWHMKLGMMAIDAADLAGAAPWLSAAFSSLGQFSDFGTERQQLIAGGWSGREGRPVAWFFDSDDGFNPVPLTLGHTICPEPRQDAAAGDDIVARWSAALEDPLATRDFHADIYANQVDQAARGDFDDDSPCAVIGGGVDAAVIGGGEVKYIALGGEPLADG